MHQLHHNRIRVNPGADRVLHWD